MFGKVKDEKVRDEIIQIIANMWMTWTDEQKQDYLDAINSGDWEPYKKKYNLGEIFYKQYDDKEEIDSVEVINFKDLEESDEFISKRIDPEK